MTAPSDYEELLHEAVENSPWVADGDVDQVSRDILHGDEDVAMQLLLPLLPNLRHLNPPLYGCQTAEFLRKVAQAQALKGLEDASVPLRKLVLLTTVGSNGEFAFPIRDQWLTLFAGLRSLKRIVLTNAIDQSFGGWPDNAVRPVCPEVLIAHGGVSVAAIRQFAAGWAGPCSMRLIYSSAALSCDPPPEPRRPQWQWCFVRENHSNNGDQSTHFEIITKMRPGWDGEEDDEGDHQDMYDLGIDSYGGDASKSDVRHWEVWDWSRLVRTSPRRGTHNVTE